jgi:hypothetical protein
MVLLSGCNCDDIDIDAFRRSVAMVKREGPAGREMVETMLTTTHWVEVAEFCSHRCQMKRLGLAPWQQPPCTCGEDDADAGVLLGRMLEAGISQWEPDPLAALAKVQAKAKTKTKAKAKAKAKAG